jgi:hypothetical protein
VHTEATGNVLLREWCCGGLTIAVNTKIRIIVIVMIENMAAVDIGKVTTMLRAAAQVRS